MDDDLQKKFLHLYTHEFPEQEQVRISSSTSIGAGWESDLFALHLEYEEAARQQSEDVVLKIYHGQSGSQKAQNEALGLQQLASGGYSVPRVLFAVPQDSPFGQACVVMEKIEGRTLSKILSESSQEKRHELITLFCQLYVKLHNLDWQPLVPDPASYQTDGIIASWLAQRRPFVEQVLPGVFDSVLDWLQAKAEDVPCQRLSIIHGDFHPENILLRDDGTPFVIDWTNRDISDYRLDLAWTLLLLGTEWTLELRDSVRKEYERLAGQPAENNESFDVIACTRRLVDITASLRNGATTMGMKPGAEIEMRQKAKQVRAIYAQLQERTGCTLPEIEQLMVSLPS
jgi:aminoglycoside phosphotransferase (APT) family kinase protein